MERLQVCVVEELEKCEESTPANLMDSGFKFIRNNTPCTNVSSIIVSHIFSINSSFSNICEINMIIKPFFSKKSYKRKILRGINRENLFF